MISRDRTENSGPAGAHAPGRIGIICGIAGLYARDASRPLAAIVRAQCEAIRHRGPDDDGIHVDGRMGFGMRRLSIVDIAGSPQPIRSPDGRYVLIFNGEVYNFRDLRRELEATGRRFSSDGDGEVVLAGYERWGDAVWARLDGMFAVAIWDRASRRLLLARDAIGIKPLYVTEQPTGFGFASELKALTVVPGFAFAIDPDAVFDYFRFGHIRGPRSIHDRVATLPPGHLMHVGPDGPNVPVAWRRPRYDMAPPIDEDAWVDAFRRTWIDTVGAQMVADVEIGAFLSGGIDSSAVVAAMSRIADRPVRTFTIAFPDPRYDESLHAEAVARHVGARHTTRMLEPARARDLLPAVERAYDEPFADPSAVPTWYVSRLAAEHVKVALSGDGGDELFFGYKRHATERRVGALHPALRWIAGRIPAATLPSAAGNAMLQRWRKTGESAALPDGVARFYAKTQITSETVRARLFDPAFVAAHDGGGIAGLCATHMPDPQDISDDTLEQFALCDLAINLPAAMLTKVDRASMAHSLEVRVPMLGQSIVDLALSMPAGMKLRGGLGKYVVRRAIAPWLPPGVLERRKQGFQMPLATWFAGDFGRYAEELWRDSGVAGEPWWQAGAVDRLFAEHRKGDRDHSRFLYALAVFCLWWIEDRAIRRAS